jgi:hypothetical protein
MLRRSYIGNKIQVTPVFLEKLKVVPTFKRLHTFYGTQKLRSIQKNLLLFRICSQMN